MKTIAQAAALWFVMAAAVAAVPTTNPFPCSIEASCSIAAASDR